MAYLRRSMANRRAYLKNHSGADENGTGSSGTHCDGDDDDDFYDNELG